MNNVKCPYGHTYGLHWNHFDEDCPGCPDRVYCEIACKSGGDNTMEAPVDKHLKWFEERHEIQCKSCYCDPATGDHYECTCNRHKKMIVVEWVPEKSFYGKAMKVTESDHPSYVAGSRFDFGFLDIATIEGYTVVCMPVNQVLFPKEKE